ncbi:C40 family peptidase [Streptomyces sp. NPDC050560]|uniref:C40 family peptidase n=1 Tax=Streptomyces sp. NPDC050560 TaxID=3365630 RepID=UPI0037B8E519
MDQARRRASVAVGAACALFLLLAPGTALAAPGPPAPGGGSTDTDPPPGGDTALEAVRLKLDGLYHDAAVATDAYNAAEEKAKQQTATVKKLHHAVSDGREKVDSLRDRVGAAARAQYRSGGLPPETRLVFSDDPGDFLDGLTRVRQGQRATSDVLRDLTRTQQALESYEKDATANDSALKKEQKAKQKARKKIEKRISTAEKLEAGLKKKEHERLLRLEKEEAKKKQASWVDTGILDQLTDQASPKGKKAIAYATAQLGKPYQWGAEGPASYDCSGLTSQAWSAAGKGIPRTSQEQWRQLPHVSTDRLRPGDLIIYQSDASHVGLYIGNGMIVHAPRPGRTVTLTGAGSMPILGAVRPDA